MSHGYLAQHTLLKTCGGESSLEHGVDVGEKRVTLLPRGSLLQGHSLLPVIIGYCKLGHWTAMLNTRNALCSVMLELLQYFNTWLLQENS
jgi:hypothetical protein